MSDPANSHPQAHYPRVLIVYHSCINVVDQHGVSIRSWFADWPKGNLAQIYSGKESGLGEFCGSSYKLSASDRWFGKMFFWLKRSSLADAGLQVVTIGKDTVNSNKPSILGNVKRTVGLVLLNSGLWELFFRPKLSIALVNWVQEFKPDIIYCQGYTLGFTWLPMMLKDRFKIPICFQTGDDWPTTLYMNSPFAFLVRPIVKFSARYLIHTSTLRFANGHDMALEYHERYKVSFEPLMMCDNYDRFSKSPANRIVDQDTISIIYAGSLGGDRWEPLADLCQAALNLQVEGLKFQVIGLVSSVAPEGMASLQTSPLLQLLPAPSHEDLPSYLKGADILFLPEPFNKRRDNDIRLSISTKAHLYMMSERPTLIYAPPTTGIMSYSTQVDWGLRINEPNEELLKDALRKLATDKIYCHDLIEKGKEIALQRHNSSTVREYFRERITNAISISMPK